MPSSPSTAQGHSPPRGAPTASTPPALKGFVPAQHAPVVQKLIDAGAIVLGKTNMHELAFGISGYNEGFHGATGIGVRNPYDRARFPGGSSSGTAVAIAARLAPAGLGSDRRLLALGMAMERVLGPVPPPP